jgi:hypothetical protein
MATDPLMTVNEIPSTLPAFLALRDKLAQTPEGGAVLMVLALYLYAHAPESELALAALTICVDRSRLREVSDGYKGWGILAIDLQRIQRQLRDNPWVPQSYFAGTESQFGYKLSDPPYHFEMTTNPYSGDLEVGVYKVFVRSSGAASPRPVTLKKNNRGIWKAVEWSSLLMGVESPKKSLDDDL